MRLVKIFLLMLFLGVVVHITSAYAETSNDKLLVCTDYYQFKPEQKDPRLIKQPNGPFAVMVFQEYALGVHIGIIYYDQMGNPLDGKWWISERFWDDRNWGSDITSLCWGSDGKFLYVGTSQIYGDGGLFRINLFEKQYTRIYPESAKTPPNISMTEIISVNRTERKMKVKVFQNDFATERIVEIPLE
ncbi:MAG: hypothetical protein JXA50_02800 [Deltaproteobacteria bacterium]|nr:hypothetical protein [Deltaproteobacteria bacterium]